MANDPNRLRVLADANVLFSAYGWARFPYEVLHHAVKDDYQLVLTPHIIYEAQKAVSSYFGEEQASEFLSFISAINYEEFDTPTLEEIETHSSLVRDPKDIHVALAAINAGVDYLVTQDRDFTDQDESTEELHKHLVIVKPGTFLRVCMGWTSEELNAISNRNWSDLDE